MIGIGIGILELELEPNQFPMVNGDEWLVTAMVTVTVTGNWCLELKFTVRV